jgi:hypothetical protein
MTASLQKHFIGVDEHQRILLDPWPRKLWIDHAS